MYANPLFMPQNFGPFMSMEHTIIADSIEYAEDSFVDAKERLLDVNNWKRYTSLPGAVFELRDSHGKLVNRKAHKGDHIKINMPGAGDVHCCVVIEALEYDDYPDLCMETFTMRIKPCEHGEGNDEEETALEGALVIERRNKHLFANFHRRNDSGMEGSVNQLGLPDAGWGILLKRFVD
jgi:hypothetical protein